MCVYNLFIGGGEAEAKLRLEETIFDLRQQLSTIMWRFEDLKQKHEQLKSQLSLMPIKQEGTRFIVIYGKFVLLQTSCLQRKKSQFLSDITHLYHKSRKKVPL